LRSRASYSVSGRRFIKEATVEEINVEWATNLKEGTFEDEGRVSTGIERSRDADS